MQVVLIAAKIVLIAAHSWDNIPWDFPGRWNVLSVIDLRGVVTELELLYALVA